MVIESNEPQMCLLVDFGTRKPMIKVFFNYLIDYKRRIYIFNKVKCHYEKSSNC